MQSTSLKCPTIILTGLCYFITHNFAVLSFEQEAKYYPKGENWTCQTGYVCPLYIVNIDLVYNDHSLTVVSYDPESKNLSSRDMLTENTGPECPMNTNSF